MCSYHVPMLILYSTLILAVLDVQTKNILYETVLSYTIVVLHYYMNEVITIIIPVVDWIIVINVCHLVLLHAMITENSVFTASWFKIWAPWPFGMNSMAMCQTKSNHWFPNVFSPQQTFSFKFTFLNTLKAPLFTLSICLSKLCLQKRLNLKTETNLKAADCSTCGLNNFWSQCRHPVSTLPS